MKRDSAKYSHAVISNLDLIWLRNEKGEFLSATTVSPDSLSALYPVVTPIDEKTLFVAYTVKVDNPNEVWYQQVQVVK